MVREILQQLKLFVRHLDLFLFHLDFVSFEVDRCTTERDRLPFDGYRFGWFLTLDRMESQQIFDSCEQLVQIERLGQILIGSAFKASCAILGKASCAQDQYRNQDRFIS